MIGHFFVKDVGGISEMFEAISAGLKCSKTSLPVNLISVIKIVFLILCFSTNLYFHLRMVIGVKGNPICQKHMILFYR